MTSKLPGQCCLIARTHALSKLPEKRRKSLMKSYAMITILTLIGTVGEAKHHDSPQPADAEVKVTAYLHYDAQLPGATWNYAQRLAQKMFKTASVELCWKAGAVRSDQTGHAFKIDLRSDTPAWFHPRALAYASRFEGAHIRVFYDRTKTAAGSELAPTLLAHVLVHEITHVLQATDRHSEEGVMKAHWIGRDLRQMLSGPLPFTALDLQLIQRGLASRNRLGRTALPASN
jgi:hypothetical protein